MYTLVAGCAHAQIIPRTRNFTFHRKSYLFVVYFITYPALYNYFVASLNAFHGNRYDRFYCSTSIDVQHATHNRR